MARELLEHRLAGCAEFVRTVLVNSMLYHAYQAHADALLPFSILARGAIPVLNLAAELPPGRFGARELAAAYEVFAAAKLTHRRPEFRIDGVTSAGSEIAVREEEVWRSPFGTLVRFRKDVAAPGPRVLLVAPMSGHFATLLRETARTMLVDHDVHITDWHNARDVPLVAGRFGLDEYIEHVIDCVRALGAGAHVVAVCQPCVAALAAVAIMAEDRDPATPASITLMAGPVDCRINPTEVNRLATEKSIEWFATNLIGAVPLRYAGAMRSVYPGFLQLAAFMKLNLERHVASFRQMYDDLIRGERERAAATRAFYEEYFAVADLPAEFYLETVQAVFQDCALARGTLRWRGRRVDPAAIRTTALLTVEGERDDICALGQTMAAHELAPGIRPYLRNHYVQPGAGHYGIFSGKRWQSEVYPILRETILASA